MNSKLDKEENKERNVIKRNDKEKFVQFVYSKDKNKWQAVAIAPLPKITINNNSNKWISVKQLESQIQFSFPNDRRINKDWLNKTEDYLNKENRKQILVMGYNKNFNKWVVVNVIPEDLFNNNNIPQSSQFRLHRLEDAENILNFSFPFSSFNEKLNWIRQFETKYNEN